MAMTKPCNPGEKILLRSPGKTKSGEWMRGEGTHTEKQTKKQNNPGSEETSVCLVGMQTSTNA